MINFLLLMLFPTAIAIGFALWKHGRDGIGIAAMQLVVVALLMAMGLGIAYYTGTEDTEIWNGEIIAKYPKVAVPCSHSYQCHCRMVSSGSGKNKTYSEVCDTCYEHINDYDWDLAASTGERISIDRVDRQGVNMPPRWGNAYIGEPFASSHRYTNYIKANPASVMLGTKGDVQKFGKLVPSYPSVYDYYQTSHVYDMGVGLGSRLQQYEWLVRESNKKLGPLKQVNIILVFVPTADANYVYAFRDLWLGGKKNDAIVLIGSDDGKTIAWADVVSWNTNKIFNINVRERIMEEKYLDHQDNIVRIIDEETRTNFVRMHMKDMQWLVRNFQPSSTAMLWLFVLGIVASTGVIFAAMVYEQDNGEIFDDY